MIISTDIDFFETVYLITDVDQRARLITEVKLLPPNTVAFALSYSSMCTWHFRGEFSKEKDAVKVFS